jgi:hypothetical protein
LRSAGIGGTLVRMEHQELLAPIATLLAVEIAHLRWILWTQWHCRKCGESHVECACKPAWLKLLL